MPFVVKEQNMWRQEKTPAACEFPTQNRLASLWRRVKSCISRLPSEKKQTKEPVTSPIRSGEKTCDDTNEKWWVGRSRFDKMTCLLIHSSTRLLIFESRSKASVSEAPGLAKCHCRTKIDELMFYITDIQLRNNIRNQLRRRDDVTKTESFYLVTPAG